MFLMEIENKISMIILKFTINFWYIVDEDFNQIKQGKGIGKLMFVLYAMNS